MKRVAAIIITIAIMTAAVGFWTGYGQSTNQSRPIPPTVTITLEGNTPFEIVNPKIVREQYPSIPHVSSTKTAFSYKPKIEKAGIPPAPAAVITSSKTTAGKSDPGIREKLSRQQETAALRTAPPGGVEVLIYLDPGYFKGRKFKEALRDIAEQLGIAGIRVLDSSANPIVAVIPSESALKAAENMPEISYIREAGRPFAVPVAGSVTSQGIFNVSAVYAWRKGYNGSGVKVGVLDIPDGGFSNYQTLVSQGELPSSTQLYTPNGAGSSVHGSACAEIVYDVAPGIDGLYLATYGDTKQMYDAVKWFIDNGVRVVSHSISNFGWGPSQFDTDNDETPEFWDVYLIINYTIQNDVLWVNAAGNNRLEHWEGDWTDNDGDGILDIYGTAVDGNSVEEDREGIQVTLNSDTSTTFRAWIRWSDYPYPNGGPTNDFDAYFECQNGNQWELIAKSEDYQNGQFGQEPLESISVDLNSAGLADGNNHYCRLYIKKYNAPDSDQMHFDVWWDGVAGYWYSYGGDSTYNPVVKEGSVTPPADHPNVLAVGAVNWTDTSKLEWFSSEGPAYNSYLRSGQWLKPNVVAPDWVSTASYGAFSGTSAAAPHAAGVAALVLSAKSSLSQRDVWAILQLTAKDVNETGIDYNTGYGLVNASDATPQYLSWKYPTPENGARIDEASVVINITSLFKSLKESNLTVNNNDYTMNPMDSTNKSWSFQLNNLPNGEYVYNATTRDSFRVWIVRTGSRKFYVDLGEKTAQEGIDGDPASGGWASDQIVSPGTSTVINGVFVWKDSDDGGFTSSCTGKTYDIKGLQLRADGDYIYVMVNLSEIPNYGKPPTPLVGVGFDVNNDGNLDYYAYAFLDKVGVSAGSAEFLDIYDTDWNNVAANDPDSVFVAGGNVIEMQIPRASIGNPNGQIGISAQVYEGLGAGRICSGSDYMTDNGNTVTTVDLASVPFFSSVMMLALIVLGLSMYFRKL